MNDVRDGLLLLEMDENSLENHTYSLEDVRNVVICIFLFKWTQSGTYY